MALPNASKVNWTSDDGVQFTDMNSIGENIQHLEDTKHENGDSPTYITTNVTTLNMLEAINPTISPTVASEVVSAGSNWIPARGLYIVSFDGASLTLQINVSGWKNVDSVGGAFPTDGSNVRINNATGGDLTAYYLKF